MLQINGHMNRDNICISKDGKSSTFVIQKTDKEGFHHSIFITKSELIELYNKIYQVLNEI